MSRLRPAAGPLRHWHADPRQTIRPQRPTSARAVARPYRPGQNTECAVSRYLPEIRLPRRFFLPAVLLAVVACSPDPDPLLPPDQVHPPAQVRLLTRLAHISDSHVIDEESPARLPGAGHITASAWRPQEACSTQLLDGIVRAVNRIHAAGRLVDFLVHTGDACDNAQTNELTWFLGVMDGLELNPRTGPDDRPAELRPPPTLDPNAPFAAQGLYQTGRHGPATTIPWFAVLGNHDVYALGTFPIFQTRSGRRVAPLPLPGRPGLLLPIILDPLAAVGYGNVTPADPALPPLFNEPTPVQPNPNRAYFTKTQFIAALQKTISPPVGHGFYGTATTWYSVSPVPGVRLIGLDTTDRSQHVPGQLCIEGAISRDQAQFLRQELEAATAAGEIVIVASHHPSSSIQPIAGSELAPAQLRELLNDYPAVVLHLCGHTHRHRVTDRGGYLEIETGSTLDWPQQGRIIEIYRDDASSRIVIAYETFGHLDDSLPELGDDPLRQLRQLAASLARPASTSLRQRPTVDDRTDSADHLLPDRHGIAVLDR
jgi:3',5'-cyclic AMP phosphodiesterase CpdA